MKIELKNLEISERIEGAFLAHLYIDNVKAGIAHNRGGEHKTVYHHISVAGKELIALAEVHCKMLPQNSGAKNAEEFTLTDRINQLAKADKHQKDAEKSLKASPVKPKRKGI